MDKKEHPKILCLSELAPALRLKKMYVIVSKDHDSLMNPNHVSISIENLFVRKMMTTITMKKKKKMMIKKKRMTMMMMMMMREPKMKMKIE